jgi:DNA processing protein
MTPPREPDPAPHPAGDPEPAAPEPGSWGHAPGGPEPAVPELGSSGGGPEPAVQRRKGRRRLLPPWWSPATATRDTLLGLAATPGPLPSVTAARLADGAEPARLLRADSPDPGLVAARLEEIGARFMLPGDPDWPFAEAPPDPPCAWLFVAGPVPPGPATSVAVVGGRKASALRRATAGSLAAGLAASGICVVSGGAIGVDAAAHAGALNGGGHTVVVLGCGLDVPYPRRNAELFRRIREAGGTLLAEHPPGAKPLAANFIPRNRLIAALSGAVVVVEATLGSGSLATARAAGSRGHGQVLAVPGAPWDRGAEGCNDLIRDGATLVRNLDDVLEALTPTSNRSTSRRHVTAAPAQPGTASGRSTVGDSRATAGGFDAAAAQSDAAAPPRSASDAGQNEVSTGGGDDGATARVRSARGAFPEPRRPWPAGSSRAFSVVPSQPWPASASRAAWHVLEALTDQRPVGLARLSDMSGLDAAQVASALLELELAGFVRRTSAGAEAVAMPIPRVSRGPPRGRGRTRPGAPSADP